ncbi:MAG: HAMP domain-containing sensor histidine kinase [Armatimonadota bacterium]
MTSRIQIRLALTLLAVMAGSWALSTGISNYFTYLQIKSVRQTMLNNPQIYTNPFPEPKFGVREFIFGSLRDSLLGMRPPGRPSRPNGPPPPEEGLPNTLPPRPPDDRSPSMVNEAAVLRALLLIVLAVGVSGWLSRKVTRPLNDLANAADAYRSGDFTKRVSVGGDDEFAAVAGAMNQMATDVSASIEDMRRDAEKRRQFLADAAHELRSPVSTIKMMAGALQDGTADSPERKGRAIASIARTSDRLHRLVNDLMDLARLDLNELPLKPARINIGDIAREIIESCQQQAETAHLALRLDIPTGPVTATADPDRLSQVLDNILNNAISHAEGASEAVISVKECRSEDSKTVEISICDNGNGIAEDHLDRVFDSFYRADAARSPEDDHSGLGLRISRGMVEAMGGTLTLTSCANIGTTVIITLPTG